VVHDAATTGRNSVTAVIKEYLLDTQRQQHERIRQMAERLSAFTDLRKYATADPPPWERTNPRRPLYAATFDDALSSGEAADGAYQAVAEPVLPMSPRAWTANARRAFTARLATIDVADAVNIAAAEAIGGVRTTGRNYELTATAALQMHVTDPSTTQSATAVLDKIGGAVLVAARQRQARMRVLTGIVEELLVDSKRARDTDTAAANMQILTWREAAAANHAFRTGTGDALQSWRQP